MTLYVVYEILQNISGKFLTNLLSLMISQNLTRITSIKLIPIYQNVSVNYFININITFSPFEMKCCSWNIFMYVKDKLGECIWKWLRIENNNNNSENKTCISNDCYLLICYFIVFVK